VIDMSSIREYFQVLNGASIKPSQILQAGNDVYLSESAVADGDTLHKIAEFYRSIHATTYGQMLPATATLLEHTITITGAFETVYSPSANEVLEIQAFQIVNSALAPVVFQVGCSNVACYQGTVDPSGTFVVPLSDLPHFSNGQGAIAFNQVDGSVGDLDVKVVYSLKVA
jgi:hypothetical protein